MICRRWRLVLIGGPYDGVDSFAWDQLDEDVGPPGEIDVGTCPRGRLCEVPGCRPARSHPKYWLVGDPASLAGAVRYVKHEESEDWATRMGEAVYAFGNVVPVMAIEGSVGVGAAA